MTEEMELLIKLFKMCGGDPLKDGTNPHYMYGYIKGTLKLCPPEYLASTV